MAEEMTEPLRIWMIDDRWTLADVKEVCPLGAQIDLGTLDEDAPAVAFQDYHLILLDQDLNRAPSLARVFDGSGVAGQLRALARKGKLTLPPLVILTSEPDLFEFEVPAVGPERPFGGVFIGREAQLAPALDVEWLLLKPDFDDEDALATTRARIADLANSYVTAVELAGGNGVSFEESSSYLRFDAAQPWGKAAASAVEAALPPISQDPGDTAAAPRSPTSLVRWLLHRALPYPGLFVSDLQAAARLGVRPEAMEVLCGGDSTWSRSLAAGIYRGPGATLFSRRWWTAAIDLAALDLFDAVERTGDHAKAITELAGRAVELLDIPSPVVVYDQQFVETNIVALETAVQVRPPGWPIEAMLPWMSIETAAAHSWLRHLVDPADAAEAGLT